MDKLWKDEDVFTTYELASKLKKRLLTSPEGATLQVKIRRYAPSAKVNTETFVVKSRQDPALAAAVKEVEEKLVKKTKKK